MAAAASITLPGCEAAVALTTSGRNSEVKSGVLTSVSPISQRYTTDLLPIDLGLARLYCKSPSHAIFSKA